MGVNLSSICCSRVFGCYNFSSVSCCKTHQLCLYPGFHHSCETLISETHSPITALADVCCLVHSPAGSWLLSWYPPGTTSNCETLVILEMGLLWCSLGGPQRPLLISSHFPEPGKDLSPGVWESKLSCDFVVLNLGSETGLSIIVFFRECILHYILCRALCAPC